MRKITVPFLALFLVAGAFFTPSVTHAGTVTSCWADSYKLSQGQSTNIYCSGFSPLTILNTYYAEPDGTAVIGEDVKSDQDGNVVFRWTNGVKNQYSYQLGTYKIVVQQLGLAHAIVAFGTVEISFSGEGDNVSGALLTSSQSKYDITSDSIILTGSGFAPGEIVTLWIQRPALCSSYTYHYVDGKNGAIFDTAAQFDEVGTYQVDDIKADSTGGFVTQRFFGLAACEGTWRYAARGNTSGLGATTEIVLTGPSVATNASLIPSKNSVGAFNDTIQFAASGFGANEILNCWTTSPDGRALAYGQPGSFDSIKMGADGSGVISLTTGAFIASKGFPPFPPGFIVPVMSEGSLGVWKLTCTGVASKATAIASYTVYGYELTP